MSGIFQTILNRKGRRGATANGSPDENQGPDRDFGLGLLASGVDPIVDIVAVHGLNGHREESWTAKNGVLWLKDLLPERIPYARIYTYGWDASVHGSRYPSRDTFHGQAENFVSALSLKRRQTKTEGRPIIFLAHSLGGLLVKRALIESTLANENHLPHYKDIQLSTRAILFFGTPHQGSAVASWGKAVLSVARLFEHTNGHLLAHLEKDSESLEISLRQYASISDQIRTFFFYESRPTHVPIGPPIMVVEKSSAVVPGARNTEAVDTGRDHVEMVKFGSPVEGLFDTICTHLQLAIEDMGLQKRKESQSATQVSGSHSSISHPMADRKKTGPSRPKNPISGPPPQTGLDFPRMILPYGQNDKFVGREDEINNLHECLKQGRVPGSQRTCAIYGLGGLGKTQRALQYVWTYRDCFNLIVWLRASSLATLAQDFSQVAVKIGIVAQNNRDQRKDIECVREWLASTDINWLLVFDDLYTSDLLHQYRPISDHGSILITTQNSEIAAAASMKIPLKPLSTRDGSRLLLSYLTDEKQKKKLDEAISISSTLGGLPLAIMQVAGFIDQSQMQLEQFPNFYSLRYSHHVDDTRVSLYEEQYERTYGTVWSLALNKISDEAREFIETLAFFNSDTIPEETFIRSSNPTDEESVHDFIEFGHNFNKLIRSLRKWSLIDRIHSDDGSSILIIHRQLQRSLLRGLNRDRERCQTIFNKAVDYLRNVFPCQDPIIEHMTQDWPECAKYLAQVLSFHEIYKNFSSSMGTNLIFANILCDSGQYMWEQSLTRQANEVLQQAESILNSAIPIEEPCYLRASILRRQASVDIEAGYSKLHDAISKLRAAIGIHERLLADIKMSGKYASAKDGIPLANALNNLGCCYLHLSNFEDAESLFQQSLSIKERWKGTVCMQYEFAEGYKNLAIVRASQGRFDEAFKFSSDAIKLVEEQMGPESSRTYFFKFIDGWIHFDAGLLDKSLSIQREVLEARKRILGESHGYTAASYYTVGTIYHSRESLSEAEPVLRKSIEIWSKSYSQERVARAKFRLSLILENRKPDEAHRLRKEALSIRKELLGPRSDTEEESMEAYDSLVSVWNGRSFRTNNNACNEYPGKEKRLHLTIRGKDKRSDFNALSE